MLHKTARSLPVFETTSSGFIVGADVLNKINEDALLMPAVEDVQ